MASIDGNAFEIERRCIQLKFNTNMPDETTLGWDNDPNTVSNGNTAGETLIYNVAQGSTFLQSNGKWWFKKSLPNTWIEIGGATSVASNVVTHTIASGNTQQFYSLNLDNNQTFDFTVDTIHGTDRSYAKHAVLWADPAMEQNEYSFLGHNIDTTVTVSGSGTTGVFEITNNEATDITCSVKVEAFNAL